MPSISGEDPLSYPGSDPVAWYSLGAGGYNGPLSLVNRDLLLSVVELRNPNTGGTSNYLAIFGGKGANSAFIVEVRSDTQGSSFGTAPPAGAVVYDGQPCPGSLNVNWPVEFAAGDDELNDCFLLLNPSLSPYGCFGEGPGLRADFIHTSPNTDGAVIGPLPDGGFEILVDIIANTRSTNSGIAISFTYQSISFQTVTTYHRLQDISDPSLFTSASFAINYVAPPQPPSVSSSASPSEAPSLHPSQSPSMAPTYGFGLYVTDVTATADVCGIR